MKKRLIVLTLIFTLTLSMMPTFAGTWDVNAATTTSSSAYNVTKNGTVMFNAADMRLKSCKRMFDMSNVAWSIDNPVEYEYIGKKAVLLEPGKYKGIPYTQNLREHSITSNVQANMTEVSNTIDKKGLVYGVDCSSAASFALRNGMEQTGSDKFLKQNSSKTYVSGCFFYDGMLDSEGSKISLKGSKVVYRNNLNKVGNYGKYTGFANANGTDEVIAELLYGNYYKEGNFYSNVYAKMRPGDILVEYYRNQDTGSVKGHIMMVERVELVYKGKEIDENESKVYLIDQSTPNKSIYPTGELTSWRNDNTLSPTTGKNNNAVSFNELVTTIKAIPVTSFKNTYKITYDANGGTASVDSQTKKPYENLKLSEKAPTRKGYTFTGWTQVKDPMKGVYQPGDTYSEDFNETLLAGWKANQYSIQYNANGGKEAPLAQTKTYGKALVLRETIPTRAGYNFMGWDTDPDVPKAKYKAGDTMKKDHASKEGSVLKLYAIWKKISVTCKKHNYKHIVKDAGLLKDGYKYDKCTKCGKIKNKVTLHGYSKLYVENFKVAKGTKSFTVKWKKQSTSKQNQFTKYQIKYSTKSNMTGAKYISVDKSLSSKKVEKLKAKKKYYVKARTYKKVDGVTYFSKWTKAVIVITK